MTNLPSGTTETKPAPQRRRLNRVITVSALAAGALTAFAVPAQASYAPHQAGVMHGTGSRNAGPADCGNRQRDNGGRNQGVTRYFPGGSTCTVATAPNYTSTPAPGYSSTPSYSSTPAYSSAPAGTTTRGATITYNEGYAGSCVFYALDRFHQYTGVYPKAFGDARYLATGSAASGWATGTTPRVNSLVVFQPGQNGAGSPTGHVAWVEQVSGNQIYIAEMNAPTPYVVTRRWMTPVSGVRYVYA